MDEGYIKLYRKITESDVFFDKNALQVFLWILTSVNTKTGSFTTGRMRASEALKMAPSTFYKVLKKLQKKYHLCNITATARYTTISLINWDKYQHNRVDKLGITQKDSKTEQQSNTKQELKNKEKEYINTNTNVLGAKPPISEKNHKKIDKKPDKRDPKIQKGIDLAKKLLGSLPKEQLNRFALKRLFKKYGEEETLSQFIYARDNFEDRYCPTISNFLDLEEKWIKLADYQTKKVNIPKDDLPYEVTL